MDPETSFDDYVAGASLASVIEHMGEYLEALDCMATAHWRFSQFSKDLDRSEADFIADWATLMCETISDVEKLHKRARELTAK